MTIVATGLEMVALRHVAQNMRDWDRREIFATRWNDNPDDLAATIMKLPGPAWLAWRDGQPVAAIGALECWPGVWSPWCFGTHHFGQVALLLTRLGKRAIIPLVRARGGHRLEVKSLDGHVDAQAWLERAFGFRHEAAHPGYGRGGETFHTYAMGL